MMLSQSAVKTAANKLLKNVTGLKTYGKEVIEGYETPSFFIELITKPTKRETKSFAKSGFTLHITYFQKTPDEAQQLQMYDTVKNAFGMIFTVEDRKLTVNEITYDYVGNKENILQITVEFKYYENTAEQPTADIAEELDLNLKKTEEA